SQPSTELIKVSVKRKEESTRSSHREKKRETVSPLSPDRLSPQLTIKSAILIQKWYRRCVARLEARRRASWNIFTALEYAGEQDQLKLYDFFSDVIGTMLEQETDQRVASPIRRALSIYNETADSDAVMTLLSDTQPDNFVVEKTYKGPDVKMPLTRTMIGQMIEAFKLNKILHIKYVFSHSPRSEEGVEDSSECHPSQYFLLLPSHCLRRPTRQVRRPHHHPIQKWIPLCHEPVHLQWRLRRSRRTVH
ncbi:hypothetical protein PMAYCL1PPCAC_12321, partial [Pristionchus mayeri]